jgi:predicted CXXCH cytochrome family protein
VFFSRGFAIALLTALAAAFMPAARPAFSADVYDQEKCSLCHIRQSVFFDGRFIPSGKVRDFGEERICASCHNGVVSDSRAVIWRGAQHPPVGGGEKGDSKRCSRCHSPHTKNGGWSLLAGTSVSIRRNSEAQCIGCHPGQAVRQGAIHQSGFAEGGCKECHRAHGGVGRALLRESRETLCFRCHPMRDSAAKGGHPTAVASSESLSGRPFPECVACHPVHPKPGGATRGGAALCIGCHPSLNDEVAGKPRHPGVGDCLSCHVFHTRNGAGGKALRGREIRPEILCAGCHPKYKAETVKQARGQGMHLTKVGEKQDLCFRCHKIHKAAPGTPLLMSAKAYSCFECHDQQNTISEVRGIVLSHPVFERIEKKRLDSVGGKGKRLVLGPKGEIVCRTCHSVHNALPGTTLIAGAAGGSAICYPCHEEMRGKDHVGSGKGDADARARKDGKDVKEVGCGICHPVHGRSDLPEDPWKKLCSECHPRVSMHPQGEADRATRRPAELPAFDARGRTVRIGTISCPTCHQPHGMTDNTTRLRKAYRPSGFLCTACHPDRENVALTPHDLRGVAGDGFCEPCHIPHGGTSPWMLGVTPDPAAAEPGEGVCRSCHKEKGLATPVAKGGHPRNILVSHPIPDSFPLSSAKHGGVAGMLVCTTCHDVHGTGFAPVGAGTGKLLRRTGEAGAGPLAQNEGCLPCHKQLATHAKADCVSCHPPHGDAKPDAGCAGCHAQKVKGTAARHIEKGKGCTACHKIHPKGESDAKASEKMCVACHPKMERLVGTPHGEIEGGVCGSCHPVHREPEKPVVKPRAYEENFEPNLACQRCHQEGGVANLPKLIEHPTRKKKVPTNYGGNVTLESVITMVGRFQEGGKALFPLFDEKGNPGLSGRIGCLTCHDPHAGVGVAPGKSERVAGSYLRDPSDNFIGEICGACHHGDAVEHTRKFHTLPRKEVD